MDRQTSDPSDGKLIVFEGPDGVGKTTLAKALTEQLRSREIDVEYAAFPGNEKGSLGWLVHRLHHDPAPLGVSSGIPAASLQLLHVAAHVDVIGRLILPRLQAGSWVVLDRYWWSTWVYGRRDGVPGTQLARMLEVEQLHWRGVQPATVFLVDRPDRTTASSEAEKLWNLYQEIALRESARLPVAALNNERPIQEVVGEALNRVTEGGV